MSLEGSLVGHAAFAVDQAQTTSQASAKPDDLQEIVVTGYRQSLQTALDAKRNSTLPIESVAAEDIGKMPDNNVAESLQRLPGIQIDRSGANGQGNSVLIDGLRQNLVTLNGDIFLTGKEFYVSGEASGGGAGGNSQYGSLQTIPSQLVSGIDVYKNPNASITEGGLGGTINLKTADPLRAPDGLSLAGLLRGSDAQRQNDKTPDGTLVGSFKVNDRLALSASLTYSDLKTHTQEYQDANRSGWVVSNSATPPYTGSLTAADVGTIAQNYIVPQLGYFTDIYDETKEKGASFDIGVKLTDSITSNFLWFYSREEETTTDYSDKAWFNGQDTTPIPGIDPTQPYSIDGNGVVQSATFNALGAETATLYQDNISWANNFQWVTKFDDGGPLRGLFDGAFAHATSNLQAAQADVEHGLYNTNTGVATSPTAPGCNNGQLCPTATTGNPGYVFNYHNGGTSGLPSISYLPPDVLSNPAYTTFKSNWAWANYTDQKDWSVKGEVQWDPAFITDVKTTISGGVRYASREIDQTFGRYLINGINPYGIGGVGAGTAAGNCCISAASGTYIYYSDPGYATIPYSTAVSNPSLALTVHNFAAGNIIVKNPSSSGITNPSTYLQKVWSGAGIVNNTEQFFKDTLSSFSVDEKTTAPYIMVDMGSPSSRFHMNFGVRLVDTDLTVNGAESNPHGSTFYGTASWNGVNSNNVPVTTKRNYTDVLPSFNFLLDVTESQKVRFSAARVVAPQDLYSLGLGNSYNFTRGADNPVTGAARFKFGGGTAGNPNLDPYRASQFLLSYENYFAPGGVAAIGTFYKQVDNFVETENIPTFVKDDFGGTTSNVTQPVNAGNGRIYGVELSGQYAFGDAVAWLRGVGFAANYTYSQSQSQQPTSFTTRGPIPGVSRDALTGTLYYENHGFSIRGSYSYRDKALNDSQVGATFAFGGKVYEVFSAPYGQLDAQASYDFNKHIGIIFSVQNLTDEAQHTYLQWTNEPFTYDDWGRRFFLGVKGKL
ncbi:MAG TPA: TonB-dependent receptor [Steroidobacteraceae bacterium]|nr:TonB-dependent receptor [Steroidobacteraceae bacterium]